MPNHASVTLIGHLGKSPETRYAPSGDAIVSFSLATNSRRGKDQDDLTTWWNCTCWGKRGEALAQYTRKGDPLMVRGEPCLRPWTGRDGSERQSLEVRVDDFAFLRGKDGDQGSQEPRSGARGTAPTGSQGQNAPAAQSGPQYDDEIPF